MRIGPPTLPLYLGSAILIELLALAVPLARRPLVSNVVVLLCTLAIVTAIACGVGRYSRRGSASEPAPDRPVEAPVPSGAGSR